MKKYPLTFILYFILPVLRLTFEVFNILNTGSTLTILNLIDIMQIALILIMFILLWRGMDWAKYVIALVVILSQMLYITPPLLIPMPEVRLYRKIVLFIFFLVGFLEFYASGLQNQTSEDVTSDETT
jgi:hypothetical protein